MLSIPESKDGGRAEGRMKGFEGLLLFSGPFKGGVLLGQVIEWVSNLGEVLDEAVVEVSKAQEPSYFSKVGWSCPVTDSLHFTRVHGYLSLSDDQA